MVRRKWNPEFLYVTIISVVGILTILALSLNQAGLLDSAVVYGRQSLNESEYQNKCTDTDPSNLFDVKGEVRYLSNKYNDICMGGRLYQVFCDSSLRVRLSGGYDCANGCNDGACIAG